jgi:hypothetical protein
VGGAIGARVVGHAEIINGDRPLFPLFPGGFNGSASKSTPPTSFSL